MRRRLLIVLIVVTVAILAFVVSGCSQLSSKESTAEKKFSAMVPELSIRYKYLEDSVVIAQTAGGKRDVVTDTEKSLKKFSLAKKNKNVDAQLDASRELETEIGRLRASAASSPKLSASTQLAAAVASVDKSLPGTVVREAYKSATESYENQRSSWRYLISSIVGGYSAPRALEFSIPPAKSSL